MTRSNVHPADIAAAEWRDDFERELWLGVARFAFAGQRRQAERTLHLARGYRAGIGQDEVLERIEAGEVAA